MKAAAILIALVLLTVGSHAARAETKIGVSMREFDDVFLTYVRESIAEEVKKTPGVTADLQDAKQDTTVQLAQIEGFIQAGVDAVIITPQGGLDIDRLSSLGALAKEANIPFVFVNNAAPNDQLGPPLVNVISNHAVAGRLQMRKAAALAGGKGSVLILRGPDASAATHERTAGVKEVAKQYPGIKIIGELTANWKRDQALAQVTAWLKEGNTADIILANNDEMALGAIQAYQEAGIPLDSVLVGGVDGTPAALKAMEDGTLTLTVLQNAKAQGKQAVIDAIKLTKGEAVPLYDWVPYELISQKNLADYQ